jgi:hypothetical protein
MTKEFVTYEQAVALKELGFDDGCLAQYVVTLDGIGLEIWNDENYDSWQMRVSAPLKQQAFKFFREKHDLIASITIDEKGFDYTLYVPSNIEEFNDNIVFDTYEEAEQACLDKLIEICKNK